MVQITVAFLAYDIIIYIANYACRISGVPRGVWGVQTPPSPEIPKISVESSIA